ncbi:hypothetical protein C8T65DRAFT_658049, partial [Cerioporus squamosus]
MAERSFPSMGCSRSVAAEFRLAQLQVFSRRMTLALALFDRELWLMCPASRICQPRSSVGSISNADVRCCSSLRGTPGHIALLAPSESGAPGGYN